MTNEEVERAIDFLLRSQANLEARVEQTSQQIAETNKQLAETNRQLAQTTRQLAEMASQHAETNKLMNDFADTQTQFIQVVTRTFEAQARINDTLAAGQARTDEALARLAEAQANSDRRLEALIDIVQGGRGGQ
jgi:chromosome segregation ATPase